MQATHKRTAPFLTTVRTLSNIERLAQWQRRKQAQRDLRDDDQRYLLVWLIIGALLGLAVTVGQFFLPCLVVFTGQGIHCL
jgi:hypothetical protein